MRQRFGKTPLIAWTRVSPCYTQFKSFRVKEADRQEEEGGVGKGDMLRMEGDSSQ